LRRVASPCLAFTMGKNAPGGGCRSRGPPSLPLFIQALSVYTEISLQCRIGPQCLYCQAICVEFLFGSMNIRKHSVRFSLQVIDGLKVISPLLCLANLFLCFRDLISDSPSGGSCFVGLYFGGMRLSLVQALSAHLCGFLQPRPLSLAHSGHVQFQFLRWVTCRARCQSRANVLSRSATLETLCIQRRHFACKVFIGLWSAER
jgi:hypothetical protein